MKTLSSPALTLWVAFKHLLCARLCWALRWGVDKAWPQLTLQLGMCTGAVCHTLVTPGGPWGGARLREGFLEEATSEAYRRHLLRAGWGAVLGDRAGQLGRQTGAHFLV